MLNDLMWEVIVRFVDIDGIVDHHCLDCLLITETSHAASVVGNINY